MEFVFGGKDNESDKNNNKPQEEQSTLSSKFGRSKIHSVNDISFLIRNR